MKTIHVQHTIIIRAIDRDLARDGGERLQKFEDE